MKKVSKCWKLFFLGKNCTFTVQWGVPRTAFFLPALLLYISYQCYCSERIYQQQFPMYYICHYNKLLLFFGFAKLLQQSPLGSGQANTELINSLDFVELFQWKPLELWQAKVKLLPLTHILTKVWHVLTQFHTHKKTYYQTFFLSHAAVPLD